MAAQDAQPFRWRSPDLDDKNFELHGHALLLLLLAFSLILLMSVVCLYMRWWCMWASTGLPTTGTPPPGPDRPNRQSGLSGLDPSLISSLPVLLHRQAGAAAENSSKDLGPEEEEEEELMCSICLSVFEDGEKVKLLPNCGHVFHPECVDRWLLTRSTCPVCRASIGEFQKVEHNNESPV